MPLEIPTQFFDDVVKMAEIIRQAKLESSYQELFDRKPSHKDIDFLKTQKIADIEIEEDVPGETFLVKNVLTEQSIKFSDRESSREMRGESLKRLLRNLPIEQSDLTLEQAFSPIVSSRNSSMYTYSLGALFVDYPEISQNVIANFLEIILEYTKKGVEFADESGDISPQQLKKMVGILNNLITLDSPEFKRDFYKKINKLVGSAVVFDETGDKDASVATTKLRKKLSEAAQNFFAPVDPLAENRDKQGFMAFKTACQTAFSEASQNLRVKGLVNNFVQFLKKAASYVLSILPIESAKSSYTFFKTQTSTEEHLDDIEKEIKQRTSHLR